MKRRFHFSVPLLTALASACAPATPPGNAIGVPGVDASARRLLGPATPGATAVLSSADRSWV
ncbi:MAG TPA: hypothetical protein VFS56_06385, partial [Gemmatimonadaceae bacterium]|nr:hypothetical protein [Gemmatimonadaceae bacterium]